jgi:Arc/MetJ-type ribon-helix-helix transcriptional regulator
MSMQYQFPPDLQQWVDARLSAGVYQSPDDLLREAMQALDELDREKLLLFQEGNRVAMEQSFWDCRNRLTSLAYWGELSNASPQTAKTSDASCSLDSPG